MPEDVVAQVELALTIRCSNRSNRCVGVAAALSSLRSIPSTELNVPIRRSLDRHTRGQCRPAGPLAERMRPATSDEFVRQQDILAPGKPLREADRAREPLAIDHPVGSPGTGKTTLGPVHREGDAAASWRSARCSRAWRWKEVMAVAEHSRRQLNRRTIVFVDEIHRFNENRTRFCREAGDIV